MDAPPRMPADRSWMVRCAFALLGALVVLVAALLVQRATGKLPGGTQARPPVRPRPAEEPRPAPPARQKPAEGGPLSARGWTVFLSGVPLLQGEAGYVEYRFSSATNPYAISKLRSYTAVKEDGTVTPYTRFGALETILFPAEGWSTTCGAPPSVVERGGEAPQCELATFSKDGMTVTLVAASDYVLENSCMKKRLVQGARVVTLGISRPGYYLKAVVTYPVGGETRREEYRLEVRFREPGGFVLEKLPQP